MRALLAVRLPAATLILTALLAPALAPAMAWGDAGTDSRFVSATNSARSGHGLRGYSVAGDLTAVARRWAAHMAAHRTLAHNPSYSSEICCWTKAGENVGVGGSVSQIQRALMASAPHRANILSSGYTQVGIGTARSSDGRLWVDEVFRRPTSAAAHTSRTTGSTARTTSASPVAQVRRPAGVHQASKPALARASRSAARHPRMSLPRPAPMTWSRRVAWARAAAPPDAAADPVSGAIAFVRVMQRLESSTAG